MPPPSLAKAGSQITMNDPIHQGAKQTLIRATLRECHLFSDLSSEDLSRVSDTCILKHLNKGETLFHEGDPSDGFYIVQTGSVNIHRTSSTGQEQVLHIFRPYDAFAEITLTEDYYPADAVALENAQLVLVRKKDFSQLVMQFPKLSLKMLASMSVHLKQLVEMIEGLKFRSIESRLANWLLRNSQSITHPPNQAHVELDVAKKVLANQLGVTSETFSRTLNKLREQNLIEVQGATIQILDSRQLETLTHE